MNRHAARLALAALLVLFAALPALAHKVNIFAYAENGSIHTESSFGGKRAVNQGIVEVRDTAGGELLLSGTTDDDGKWSFPIPAQFREKRPGLTLVIKAGEGHQGQWEMKPEDYLESGAAAAPQPAAQAAEAQAAPAPSAAQAPADAATLEQTVNRIVEAKLAPLRKQIGEAETGDPGPAEILGGLGFIMGLGALVMAARRRKG
ncbi:cobalamin biosynthesis protein CbiL [Desulfovibrio aminophilus]|nr:cobalamin biosynthesis protein CbiL [Desulfovibrio aminophilus]MCM0754929.1 cobalamin biosynthesis protein CbiL [Desulfovibrio aminophilus]